MTKTMTIQTTPVRRTQGFTLIEMLVVAALIAIFAGLAVFNIVEQLQREKEKAALAEARSIATAMSFAYNDLGFFPKLCFLRFGADEMLSLIPTLPNNAVDYFGYATPTMATMIKSNWGEKYMAGGMPEKSVKMRYTGAPAEGFDWPADPFVQPYVAYFVKIETDPVNPTNPTINWLERAGEEANYFAGIVSYGRNKVPGLTWDDQAALTKRQNNRLYVQDPANARVFTMGLPVFNQANLDLLVEKSATFPTDPNIRDAGSDDKYFEF